MDLCECVLQATAYGSFTSLQRLLWQQAVLVESVSSLHFRVFVIGCSKAALQKKSPLNHSTWVKSDPDSHQNKGKIKEAVIWQSLISEQSFTLIS